MKRKFVLILSVHLCNFKQKLTTYCMYNMPSIYEKYFEKNYMVSSKTFDNSTSILFRKNQAMTTLLSTTKPSSHPTYPLTERSHSTLRHHVLWLPDEGNSLRGSSSYRGGLRARRRTEALEGRVGVYFGRVSNVMQRLTAIAKR